MGLYAGGAKISMTSLTSGIRAEYSNATQTSDGLMSATDKIKLDGIAQNANNYALPSAGVSLGGVKSGGDVTISSGVITVNDDSHNHVIANIDGLQAAIDGKAAASHNHNDLYYTESEVDSKLSGKADANHTHTVDNSLSSTSTNPVQNKVINFALSNKVSTARTVNGKALSSDITLSATDVGADVSGAANTAEQNAKQYTDNKVSALVNGAPETLDTLKELAEAMTNNSDAIESLEAIAASKASATDLTSHASNKSNPHGVTAAQVGAISTSEKGASSGVATLGADGKVPASQLPAMDYAPLSHVNDAVKHITVEERTKWDASETNANAYTDQQISVLTEGAPDDVNTFKEVADLIKKSTCVSIKSFGAVGDGTTDDTDALLAAAASGELVYFPQGTYILGAQISQTTGLYWFGDNSRKTIIKLIPKDKSMPEEYGGNTVYNCYMIAQTKDNHGYDTCVTGITLDGNKDAFDADSLGNGASRRDHTTCLNLYRPDSVYLHDVVVKNALIDGCYIYRPSGVCKVSDCTFEANGYYQEDASGFYLEGENRRTVIANCTFENNGFHGLLMGGVIGATVSNISLRNNGFDGVCLWGGSSANILSNITCLLNRCGIRLQSSYSPYIADTFSEEICRRNVITGLNTIENTYGIMCGISQKNMISNWHSNYDKYSYGYGVQAGNDYDSDIKITGCILTPSTSRYINVGELEDARFSIETDEGLTQHINDIAIHIPSYTTADEGKFLRIVNGTPAWVSIENAEGVSF